MRAFRGNLLKAFQANMRVATLCAVAVVVLALGLAGCDARRYRVLGEPPVVDLAETDNKLGGFGDFLREKFGSSSSESEASDPESEHPADNTEFVIQNYSEAFEKIITDTVDALETMGTNAEAGSREAKSVEAAKETCQFDKLKELVGTGNRDDMALASKFFAVDCYTLVVSAFQQMEGLKSSNRQLYKKLKEVEEAFKQAQSQLKEQITASMGDDEAALSADKAWAIIEEGLETVKKLYVSFDRILTNIEGHASFKSDYEEGAKIRTLYLEQFEAHYDNARDHGFTMSTVEQMSSLLRNWLNNIGMGFRIYLKIFNKYPKKSNGASFNVVDSNTKVEVAPIRGGGPAETKGPFFYVIDGADVPAQPVLSEEEQAERTALGKMSNSKLFMSMQPWVELLANDKNDAFVVAYGNTGSGKTFALLDNPTSFVPKVMEFLATKPDKVAKIQYSAFEYKPKGKLDSEYRMLSPSDGKDITNPRWNARKPGLASNQFVFGSRPFPWSDFTNESFTAACERRTTRKTGGNSVSSRSHAVFIFKVTLHGRERDRYLGVFDLAGLETTAEGGDKEETGWIKYSFDHFKMVFDKILKYTPGQKESFGSYMSSCNHPMLKGKGPAHLLCEFMKDRGDSNPKDVKLSLIGTVQNDYDIEKTKTVIGNLMNWGEMANKQLEAEIKMRSEMTSHEDADDETDSVADDDETDSVADDGDANDMTRETSVHEESGKTGSLPDTGSKTGSLPDTGSKTGDVGKTDSPSDVDVQHAEADALKALRGNTANAAL